jgi:hypothetical protein
MPGGTWATPRPVPSRWRPAVAGTAVIVLALPVFLIAGWNVTAWAIAAGLWAAYQVIGLLLERLPVGDDSLGSAGVVAFGRLSRAVVLTGVLIAVAVSDESLGLPAAVVYASAFTVEFGMSVAAYFGGEAKA